jgi:hypothetical protein
MDLTDLAITTPGTGIATALAVNVGTAGAPVINGGALGTPSSGVATNLTGTASGLTAGTASAVAVGGITGLGTGVATALAVNVGSAGAPVVLNGAGGTPSAIVLTNATGTAASLTAGTASAVAVGGITGLGTEVATALAVNVGSAGAPVVLNGALGTPSSGVATNLTGTASGLTAGTASAVAVGGITGLGTGVATALAVNVGSAGAPVVLGGAGGTPSSLTLTNATGLTAAGVVGTALVAANIDDTAYDATSWNGDTTHAPSKNAVRDKFESLSSGSGDVVGPASSVDNAIVRFDSTTGKLIQESDITASDAATSTQNQVGLSNVHAGQTNSSLFIAPKGTGAFLLGPPADGTATGGNARGAGAVDLQLDHSSGATRVASGANSFAVGKNNIVSGADGVCIGSTNNNSAALGVAIGNSNAVNTATGTAVTLGQSCTASADYAIATGLFGVADRRGLHAHSSGRFSAVGDSQAVHFVLRCKTTTNAAVEMGLDNNGGTLRLTVASGKVLVGMLTIVGTKSDGTATAVYMRQVAIANVGGTTALVGTVNTIGTDTAAGTTIAVTANDASDFLSIAPTGISAETWRWTATLVGVEQAYGA